MSLTAIVFNHTGSACCLLLSAAQGRINQSLGAVFIFIIIYFFALARSHNARGLYCTGTAFVKCLQQQDRSVTGCARLCSSNSTQGLNANTVRHSCPSLDTVNTDLSLGLTPRVLFHLFTIRGCARLLHTLALGGKDTELFNAIELSDWVNWVSSTLSYWGGRENNNKKNHSSVTRELVQRQQSFRDGQQSGEWGLLSAHRCPWNVGALRGAETAPTSSFCQELPFCWGLSFDVLLDIKPCIYQLKPAFLRTIQLQDQYLSS